MIKEYKLKHKYKEYSENEIIESIKNSEDAIILTLNKNKLTMKTTLLYQDTLDLLKI